MTITFDELMRFTVAIVWIVSSPHSPAASFDCGTAKSQAEKLICADQTLSGLDEELARAFDIGIKNATDADAQAAIRREQRAWLKRRDACHDRACIARTYSERLAELRHGGENASKRLAITGKTHAEAAAERLPGPNDASPLPIFAHFSLTKGQSVPVCEAYLERLNRSWYPNYPTCDRPEDDRSKGFRKLERIVLSAEEVLPFWASVRSFVLDGDPDRWKRHEAWLKERGLPAVYGDRERQLQLIRAETSLHVYRFRQPIDLDNDGSADRVVMWRDGQCGYFDGPLPRSWLQIPIVLNAAGDGPDVERTRQLFGHPIDGYRLPTGKLVSRFRPISLRAGLFWYEGSYYTDGFFDEWGDFDNQRAKDPEIGNRLGVFLRRNNVTSQICEYLLDDFVDSAGVRMRRQLASSKRPKR
jgi:uncharacterized protein